MKYLHLFQLQGITIQNFHYVLCHMNLWSFNLSAYLNEHLPAWPDSGNMAANNIATAMTRAGLHVYHLHSMGMGHPAVVLLHPHSCWKKAE